MREAVNKIRKYVESESAFFNAFLEEGLRFSSSLHLCFIWIRVLKHVFQNPKEAADHLINHPFQEIWSRPSTEAYIDGLCKSLQSVSIGSPVRLSTAKRRLSEILDEETVSDETGSDTGRTPPPMKKSRVMWHSDSEEDALPSTSQIASSSKRRKKKKKKYKKTKKR